MDFITHQNNCNYKYYYNWLSLFSVYAHWKGTSAKNCSVPASFCFSVCLWVTDSYVGIKLSNMSGSPLDTLRSHKSDT
jgi:hypothetical protein